MKKALQLASVASMIDQFNIPNIQILQSLGYKVDVVADFTNPGTITKERAESLKAKLKAMDVRVIDISIPRSINPKLILDSYKKVRKIINNECYSLIHCHSPIGGAICRFASKDLRKNGTKVIYTAHGFHFYKGGPKRFWFIYYPIEKFLSRYTDILITINNEDYKIARNKFYAQSVIKIPGVGVDTYKYNNCIINKSDKRKALSIPDDAFVLLSVGELQDRKNHRIVIEALHCINNPNIFYMIVGKGELENEYRTMISNYGLDNNIFLLGFRTDIPELCKISDCFVHPSIREGLGIAPLEAMAAGLPLISSYVNGIKDYTENGISGCCVDPTSVAEMKTAICYMLTNRDFCQKCGINNIITASKYDQNNTDLVMHDIYKG